MTINWKTLPAYIWLSPFLAISLFSQDLEDLSFGEDNSLDIATWNIEWFPKNGQITVEYVTEIIEQLDLDVLVEVHDQNEMERALEINADITGINNRNLSSFKVSLDTTLNLIPMVPSEKLLITESGIRTAEDVKKIQAAGVNTFLVGESLMTATNPGKKLKEIFFS